MKSLERLSHLYLPGVRDSKKQMGRREAKHRKVMERCLSEGKILLSEDSRRCPTVCTEKLRRIFMGVLENFKKTMRRRGEPFRRVYHGGESPDEIQAQNESDDDSKGELLS